MINFFSFKKTLWGVLTCVGTLLLISGAPSYGQLGPFQIKWGFDNTLAGTTNNANFVVSNAKLQGATPFDLTPYAVTDAVVAAYVTKTWPIPLTTSSYLEVKFQPTQYDFNLSNFAVRLRRSAQGPQIVKIRMIISKYNSTEDSLSVDIGDIPLTNTNFQDVSIPIARTNQQSSFTFRFFGYLATTTNGTLQFDELILTGDRADRVLPVRLTYFNAQAIGDRVDLNWETAWERNSREFVVERSSDLKEFGSIGRVVAAGETEGKRQYSFTDATPLPGNNYYRLRAVDKDNTYEYSKVRDVVVRPDQPVLLLAGNPTSGERIRFRALSIDPDALKLTTVLGQNINFRLAQNRDGYTEMIPHSALAPGLYFLSVEQDGFRQNTKVVVH